MVEDLFRLGASVVALPITLVVRAFRQVRQGPAAILDLTVERSEDTVERARLLAQLRRVPDDGTVSAVLLRIDAPPGNWASCQDLREVIETIRESGRCVYAWVEAPGNAEMWLAASCDRVFMLKTGELGLVGVGAELTFFGAALSRLGIECDFEAAGAYKSFGEPYTRSFASAENREAMEQIVGDLQRQFVEGLAEGRDLTVPRVDELVGQAPMSAAAALEAGLVDQLCYPDEMERWLEDEHGPGAKIVSFGSWARGDGLVHWLQGWGGPSDSVAVVHLEGPIVVDDSRPGNLVRARRVVPLLRGLREDESVRAVVLHVNSPGGSAMASDLIWREVELLQRDKPVIASFEDVAASGGYYLAAPAAEIVARPGTLTGSIGVFGGKLVAREGMRKLGVHSQSVGAAPNATMYSTSQRFTDEQRVRFRASLQRVYDGFVHRVAAGRRRPTEALEPHCRGRVWTGRAAGTRGLVDREGDLFFAVDRARSLAGLSARGFRRVDLSSQPARSALSRLISQTLRGIVPGRSAMHAVLRSSLATPFRAAALDLILRLEGEPLALLPFDVRVR